MTNRHTHDPLRAIALTLASGALFWTLVARLTTWTLVAMR